MRFLVKPIITIVLLIILAIAGFSYLLRGCLSKYDERSALPTSLYFEKDSQRAVFSIVKFEKTTSYSRNGGFINKSISVSYFIQYNDAITGKKIMDKKIKKHREIKNHPVQILGGLDNKAWLFMGELMAFDPFTLELLADSKILEQKNPSFAGKFPSERRYYEFNPEMHRIDITARDGSFWQLNPSTLAITPRNEEEKGKDRKTKMLESLLEKNQIELDSLLEQKLRRPSRMYAKREISMATYNRLMIGFNDERTALNKLRDSIQSLVSANDRKRRTEEAQIRIIENFRSTSSIGFSQMRVNMDTVLGKWYGLYTSDELEKLYNRFSYQTAHTEPARRQVYSSGFTNEEEDVLIIDTKNGSLLGSSQFFLNGGFLLDIQTGKPIRIPTPQSFLVIAKSQVGEEGLIQVSRVGIDGKGLWNFDSGLKQWNHWVLADNRLLIFGYDNKELSSGDVNIFLSLDLSSGKAERYDFFTDKMRPVSK